MQCLRLASFLNRPTLLVIEALIMMGPYLTNSGKFLDASALFGLTVRLAQSIGCESQPTPLIVRLQSNNRSTPRSAFAKSSCTLERG